MPEQMALLHQETMLLLTCMNANGGVAREASRLNKELKSSEKENKRLEKELARKEKALAETLKQRLFLY